jgi:hypothetical protein
MHTRTIATLSQLETANWFTNVGVPDSKSATVLSSWQDAVDHCGSPEWLDLCLEASNQYCERLVERSARRFADWNNVAAEVKGATIPLVRQKIETVVRAHNLPKTFEDCVQWDIMHVCMEAEYADVFPPGFFASQAFWYVKGHFPCGWDGDFPKGRLIIY